MIITASNAYRLGLCVIAYPTICSSSSALAVAVDILASLVWALM